MDRQHCAPKRGCDLMKSGAGLEKLRESRLNEIERKKKLLDKLSNRPKKKAKKEKKIKKKERPQAQSLPKKPTVSSLPPSIENKAPLPDLLRLNNDQVISPSDSLSDVIELCRYASAHRTRHIAMCWPAAPTQTGLLHALATMQSQANGDKIGIRSIVFPCKSNVFHPLNHLSWKTSELMKMVRRNAEAGNNVNDWITRGCKSKDPFLFSVSQLENAESPNLHPSITDLMPHFYSGYSYSGWQDCSHRLLGNVLAKTRRHIMSRAFRMTAGDVMGRPSSAPDAIFAFDGRLSDFDLQKAITELYTYDIQPDLVLISWPLKARMEYPNWRAITAKLIVAIDSIAKEHRPGVVCITDDPKVGFKLRDELFKSACKTKTLPFELHGIPSRVGGDGLVVEQLPIKETRPLVFDLQLIDSAADKICRAIYQVAKNNGLDTLEENPLADIIGLVSRISSLPCGLRDLNEQLDRGEISERTARLYRWLDLKADLTEHLKTSPLQTDSGILMQAVENISKLMGQAYEATNFALRLASMASQATGSTHVVLVFESEFRRKVARQFLSHYTDYPEGLCFEDLAPRLHFVMTHDLDHILNLHPKARVIFVGLSTEGTRVIMTSNSIPNKTVILNTHRSALFLRRTLSSLLEHYEYTFRPFKTRIKSLIDQTPESSGSTLLMSQVDMKMPDLRLELSDNLIDSQGSSDEHNSWLIRMEDHRVLRRLPEQRVFIYDPLSENSTEQGFKEKPVRDLKVGEQVFVMSVELRLELDELLRKHDISLSVDDAIFEGLLRGYHQSITELLNEKFPDMKLTTQVNKLRSEILEKHPELTENYPQQAAMRYWIDLEAHLDRAIGELRPFAPAREPYFKAFALTLGMDEAQAAVFWSRVIQPFRFARRTGGKRISDGYATLMLEPEQLMSLGQIERREIECLTAHARQHTFAIEFIQKGQR